MAMDDVRNAMLDFQKEKMDYQHDIAELSYLRYEKVLLDDAKELKLKENEEIIPSIKITKNMIDSDKSTSTEYFVKIPFIQLHLFRILIFPFL